MVQLNNLRYVVFENGRTFVEAKMPEGVCLAMKNQDWLYRGGCFRIGSGVRVDDDNNPLPGVIFVFNWNNARQRQKLAEIGRDINAYGKLVNA